MIDILNIYNGDYENIYKGEYYQKKPAINILNTNVYENEAPAFFNYKVINSQTYRYTKLFSNLVTTSSSVIGIKTKNALNWAVGKWCRLKDGKFYIIESVSIDETEINKEEARLLPYPVGADYIIILVETDSSYHDR